MADAAEVRVGIPDSSVDAFGWALGAVSRAYQTIFSEALVSFEAGTRGYLVLATVGREKPRSQAALATHLGMDRTMMTYLIDRLETDALVRRAPDPADRRVRIITLTSRGDAVLHSLDERLRAAETAFLSGLGESDAVAVRTLIIRLANDTTKPEQAAAVCASLL